MLSMLLQDGGQGHCHLGNLSQHETAPVLVAVAPTISRSHHCICSEPIHPVGHPRMYVRPVLGEDQGMIRVLEGKLARLTQRVPTLHIEQIPVVM